VLVERRGKKEVMGDVTTDMSTAKTKHPGAE
jgi:hypothetical protein